MLHAPAGYNAVARTDGSLRAGNCIASACMMWEWSRVISEPTPGYCGLSRG